MKHTLILPLILSALTLAPAFSRAQSAYPRAGDQAILSTNAHSVSGTVTLLDADTFRVDNFHYDGSGAFPVPEPGLALIAIPSLYLLLRRRGKTELRPATAG